MSPVGLEACEAVAYVLPSDELVLVPFALPSTDKIDEQLTTYGSVRSNSPKVVLNEA